MALSQYILLLLIQLYAVSAWSLEQNGSLVGFQSGIISHDTIGGRLRVDVVIDPFNEDSVMHYVGAVSRDLPDLEKGREYELDFRFFEGASPLRKLQVMLLPGSLFSAGLLDPSTHVLIDSMDITDSVSIRFTATESKMTVLIVGESAESANHYFIDDFELREGWVEEMVCPNGMQYAGRSRYRWGFQNWERTDEISGVGNHYTAEFLEYDSRTVRRWNIDPVYKYYISNYAILGNNPIYFIDPNGADWFKNSEGKTTWHEATGKVGDEVSLKGLEGEWTNIGTEFLEFDGKSLTYSWQTINDNGSPVVNSETFGAVSGKGVDPTGYWNLTRVFDYSEDRQATPNVGPTPEGLYSINKSPFVEGTNEGGFQKYSNLSLFEQAASKVGRSSWPGSTSSWGDYRWKLQFENADKALQYGRDNFYLHGGSLWGSRGCIDCGTGINQFTQSFMGKSLGNDKVYLKVQYSEGLRFEIQNTPTNQGLKFMGQ